MSAQQTASTKEVRIGVIAPGYQIRVGIDHSLNRFTTPTLDRLEEIIAIDNHSTDGTFEKLRELQQQSGPLRQKLSIIHNDRNFGLGGSLKVGFHYMLKKQYTHIIIIHCDDQGNNEEIIASMLDQLDANPDLDVVVASRFIESADISEYDKFRIMGNHFFNFLTRLMTGVKMSDAGTGIMLCKSSLISSLPFAGLSSGLHFNPQLNILIFRDPKVKYVEIPLHWKDSNVPSHMKTINYTSGLIIALFKYAISRILQSSDFGTPSEADWIAQYPHSYFPADLPGKQ